MGSSIEKPTKKPKIVCGEWGFDINKIIEFPPTSINNKKNIPQNKMVIPEGEMAINIDSHTLIVDDNGKKVARVKGLDIMVSKEMAAEESNKAVKKFMKEKGLESIEDINKVVNFEERKSQIKNSEQDYAI